jgi:hypothetical protein
MTDTFPNGPNFHSPSCPLASPQVRARPTRISARNWIHYPRGATGAVYPTLPGPTSGLSSGFSNTFCIEDQNSMGWTSESAVGDTQKHVKDDKTMIQLT